MMAPYIDYLNRSKIEELRKLKGWSQSEAAHQSRLSSGQYWSDLMRGRKRNPSIETIHRIALAFGVHTADLLNEDRSALNFSIDTVNRLFNDIRDMRFGVGSKAWYRAKSKDELAVAVEKFEARAVELIGRLGEFDKQIDSLRQKNLELTLALNDASEKNSNG